MSAPALQCLRVDSINPCELSSLCRCRSRLLYRGACIFQTLRCANEIAHERNGGLEHVAQGVDNLDCDVLFVPWGVGQSTFGGIVGVVKDPGQRSVAGAQLTLTNLDDLSQRNASTDDNGGFEFINLKAGRYELRRTVSVPSPRACSITGHANRR